MGLLPDSTTALSRFEPITAPTPERAAYLPPSLEMPEISDSFSATGPIVAMAGFFVPAHAALKLSSDSMASIPHWAEASTRRGPVSSATKATGPAETPRNRMPSQPQRLISGESVPPQLASPQPPVSGDLQQTIQRPVIIEPVPVRSPLINASTLSGPRGSAPTGIISVNSLAASPTPPR